MRQAGEMNATFSHVLIARADASLESHPMRRRERLTRMELLAFMSLA